MEPKLKSAWFQKKLENRKYNPISGLIKKKSKNISHCVLLADRLASPFNLVCTHLWTPSLKPLGHHTMVLRGLRACPLLTRAPIAAEGRQCLGQSGSPNKQCGLIWYLNVTNIDHIHAQKSFQIKPKSDCIDQFLVDLEPKGHPSGSKSIGVW